MKFSLWEEKEIRLEKRNSNKTGSEKVFLHFFKHFLRYTVMRPHELNTDYMSKIVLYFSERTCCCCYSIVVFVWTWWTLSAQFTPINNNPTTATSTATTATHQHPERESGGSPITGNNNNRSVFLFGRLARKRTHWVVSSVFGRFVFVDVEEERILQDYKAFCCL